MEINLRKAAIILPLHRTSYVRRALGAAYYRPVSPLAIAFLEMLVANAFIARA